MNLQKRTPIRSKRITQAAKGESCTVCGANDGTTVFCHLNESWVGKGMGQKADDIAGFFGCYKCHVLYDSGVHFEQRGIMRAMYRTWRRLWELGIIGELK
jgi:Protein of unknown function (DUF1364)